MSTITKPKLALVIGNIPNVDEIDQFELLKENYDFNVITSSAIARYLATTSFFNQLKVIALPDYDDNPTYMPGLEKALSGYDMVMVKERLGLYAFQAVKAKWRHQFKLVMMVDNATAFPGQDLQQMRIVREEINASADMFLVHSESVKNALRLEGIENQRIQKYLPFVEQRVERNFKNRNRALGILGLKEGDFIVAHLGQIEWEESLFDLVDAAKLAIQEDASMARRLRLVFCGIGSFTSELRERLDHYGMLSRALFVSPSRDAHHTILLAADCLYHAPAPHRDRVDNDIYRLVSTMVNKVPVIASRTSIIEETIGKHRIDFCPNSISSLRDALHKAADAKALVGNITNKNFSESKKRFNKDRVTLNNLEILTAVQNAPFNQTQQTIDNSVLEIEAKVAAKDYLVAVDRIEELFLRQDIPVHHRGNLYRLVGDCFTKLGNATEGKNAYAKALDLDPYQAKAHIGIGAIALLQANYDAAIITFQKAVQFSPDDEMASLGLGLAFEGLGENKEALKWVTKSLHLKPVNSVALYSLVKLSQVVGNFDTAKTALVRYIELQPEDLDMQYVLAGIEFRAGNSELAQRICDQILAIDPAHEKSAALLKDLTASAGLVTGSNNG